MADVKISALPATTVPLDGDELVALVADPAGTPATEQVTVADLRGDTGAVLGGVAPAGTTSLVIGAGSSVDDNSFDDTILIGLDKDLVNAYRSVMIASGTFTTAGSPASAVGIGYDITVQGGCVVLGPSASTTSSGSKVAIGSQAVAAGPSSDSIAIGVRASATSGSGIAVGADAVCGSFSAVALGEDSTTTGTGSIAIGDTAAAGGSSRPGAVAIGQSTLSTRDDTVAIGARAKAGGTSGNYAIAIGGDAVSENIDSIAIGRGATVTASGLKTGSVAIGATSVVLGDRAVAIGIGTSARPGSVAIGDSANGGGTSASDAVAIGAGSFANHTNAVALGHDAATTAIDQVMIGPRDLEITGIVKGVVMVDRTAGTRHRVYLDGGAINIEAA